MKDFQKDVQAFYYQLLARGHKKEDIDPLLLEYSAKLSDRMQWIFRGEDRLQPPAHSPVFMESRGLYEREVAAKKETQQRLRAEAEAANPSLKKKKLPPVIIHMEYHPKGISRRLVRQAFREACLEDPFTNLAATGGMAYKEFRESFQYIVAYHRPQNIRDKLIKAQLWEEPSNPVSSFVSAIQGGTITTSPNG